MSILPWVLAELQRRVALLREEVQARRLSSDQNVNGDGIHQSQTIAVEELLDDLLKRQDDLVSALQPDQPPAQFAATYANLLAEVAGAQGLWRVFRIIFDQRLDQRVRRQLDAADLVAENCYRPCIDQARAWELITGEFREPPLVCLAAGTSALTASRGVETQALTAELGMDVGKYRALRLPIPIIVLPSDQIDSLWLFSTLQHEVGHNLDQDLRSQGQGMRLGDELRRRMLVQMSQAGVPADRRQVWQRWTEEMLADTFGVLLGGAGFAYALTSLLLPPAARQTSVKIDDDHPDGFVRVYLIALLLRRCGVPQLTNAAEWIQQRWEATPKPADVASYQAQADGVAALLIDTPLDVIGQRPLRALVPTLADDVRRAEELAAALHQGIDPQPDAGFPKRLVPSAAQIALTLVDTPSVEALTALHERALQYLLALPRPAFLGDDGPSSRFMRQLTRDIRFTLDE